MALHLTHKPHNGATVMLKLHNFHQSSASATYYNECLNSLTDHQSKYICISNYSNLDILILSDHTVLQVLYLLWAVSKSNFCRFSASL